MHPSCNRYSKCSRKISELTTYICIQVATVLEIIQSVVVYLTTYICIQVATKRHSFSKLTVGLTTYICIQVATSQVCNFGINEISQLTYASKLQQETLYYKLGKLYLTTYICIQVATELIVPFFGLFKLTTYICIQVATANIHKYKSPTRIKFVGFLPCREYLQFYERSLRILSRL